MWVVEGAWVGRGGTFDLSGSGFLVESLHVPPLTLLDGCVNKHLEELEVGGLV